MVLRAAHIDAVIIKKRWAGSQAAEPGETRATIFGAQPNKRLKLSAPVVCGRIPFVNVKARRRSLGAPR